MNSVNAGKRLAKLRARLERAIALYSTRLIILLIVVIIAALCLGEFVGFHLADLIAQIAGVLAGFLIILQIIDGRKLAKAEFMNSLEQSFYKGDEDVKALTAFFFNIDEQHPLFPSKHIPKGTLLVDGELPANTRLAIMSYLTFFESLYLLIIQNAIDIKDVDELFRRRFFKAVMNEEVQEHELFKYAEGYGNIFELDKLWRGYLEEIDKLPMIDRHGFDLSMGPKAERMKSLIHAIPENDPAVFFAFSDSVVDEIFKDNKTVSAFIYETDASGHERAVAGGFAWKPSLRNSEAVKREHEGVDLGLVEDYWQLDNTVVLPECCGNSMQVRIINEFLEKIACADPDYNGPIIATVSPTNPVSLANLEKCGFKIVKTVDRHGGHQRHIVQFER